MKIQARVSDRILKKADSFFTGSVRGRITELLQNARRAGATRVEITQSENWVQQEDRDWGFVEAEVSVLDNGAGVDDWDKLLHLGASGWGDEMEAAEDPAGIGLFSLAPRSVTIQSNGKYVVIEGDAWYGGSEIEVRDDPTPDRVERGTRVRFMDSHWGEGHHDELLRNRLYYKASEDRVPDFDEKRRRPCDTMIEAGAFGDMAVSFNGVDVPRGDFLLDGFGITRHLPELGCKIQVLMADDHMIHHSRTKDEPRSKPHYAAFEGRLPEITLNFHGQLVDVNQSRSHDCIDLPKWHAKRDWHYPHYNGRPDYSILIEMTGEPTPLRLMLPARTQLVRNEAWEKLREELVRSALLYIKERGTHRLAYHWYEKALALGIEDFPESVPVYSTGGNAGERGMIGFPYGYSRDRVANIRGGNCAMFGDVAVAFEEPDGITFGNPDSIFGEDHDLVDYFDFTEANVLMDLIDSEDVDTDDDGEGEDFDIIHVPSDYRGYSWAKGHDWIDFVVIHVPKEIESWSLWCSSLTVVDHIKAHVGFESGRVEIVSLPAMFYRSDGDSTPDVVASLDTVMNDTGLILYLLGGYSEDESTEEQDRVFEEEMSAIQHQLVGPQEANRVAAVEFARENYYGTYPKTFVVDSDGTVTVIDGDNRRERWLPDGEVLKGDAIED